MTKQQKLTKVIERAKERGFKTGIINYNATGIRLRAYHELIFSHDFAKAYFGVDMGRYNLNDTVDIGWSEGSSYLCQSWQYHLQQAVLSKDPISYYYENK